MMPLLINDTLALKTLPYWWRSMLVISLPQQWVVARRNARHEPTCTFTIVDGVRLQVYRHIACPGVWVAYAAGILGDVILVADDLDTARAEALAILGRARTKLRAGGDNAPDGHRS